MSLASKNIDIKKEKQHFQLLLLAQKLELETLEKKKNDTELNIHKLCGAIEVLESMEKITPPEAATDVPATQLFETESTTQKNEVVKQEDVTEVQQKQEEVEQKNGTEVIDEVPKTTQRFDENVIGDYFQTNSSFYLNQTQTKPLVVVDFPKIVSEARDKFFQNKKVEESESEYESDDEEEEDEEEEGEVDRSRSNEWETHFNYASPSIAQPVLKYSDDEDDD